ncbi:hypothetical protein GCM10018962_15010 [Dactylosporangium matsuzakiense]|uniref:Uncharacterized protein n=1 Tax=Dactylosporangium matsuzakiense TaxID=53360 RepID=A0A9W6KNZ7_9ACTN|nr:hypothetical protein GCM10017581_064000 [Dactylosporangium matsuzakiense]
MPATPARPRPSADVTVPDDVTDLMLWRLAFDVAVEHQRGPDGHCTNLRCTGQDGPCDAAIQAARALRAARRPATSTPPKPIPRTTRTTTPRPTTAFHQHHGPAIGRANVTTPNAGRFTGWFTHTATAAANRRRTQLPRRVPGAAQAAA